MNVVAVATSRTSPWRWRIIDAGGGTVEESSTSFMTIALAMAAGAERLHIHIERDRPPPARAPWRRRR